MCKSSSFELLKHSRAIILASLPRRTSSLANFLQLVGVIARKRTSYPALWNGEVGTTFVDRTHQPADVVCSKVLQRDIDPLLPVGAVPVNSNASGRTPHAEQLLKIGML